MTYRADATTAIQAARDALEVAQAAVNAIQLPAPITERVHVFAADTSGKTDVTAAFKAFLALGGSLIVPEGAYLIDPTQSPEMVSNTHLTFEPGAKLVAKPNAEPRTHLLLARGKTNIRVTGAHLIGDRLAHTYTDTGNSTRTHEWGFGIKLADCTDCLLEGCVAELCTGDGINVSEGSERIEVINCSGLRNRRQGLTIGTVNGVVVKGGNYSFTGHLGENKGAAPMAGIDVEPDSPGKALNVRIEGVTCEGNGTAGILAYTKDSGVVDGLTLEANTLIGNPNGVVLTRVRNVVARRNNFRQNKHAAYRVETGAQLDSREESITGSWVPYRVLEGADPANVYGLDNR